VVPFASSCAHLIGSMRGTFEVRGDLTTTGDARPAGPHQPGHRLAGIRGGHGTDPCLAAGSRRVQSSTGT
jgi:hypothetical protein